MDDVPPILVVEDEVLIRLSMTEALEQGDRLRRYRGLNRRRGNQSDS